ncbi:MAG TPA: hypothetical protein EYP55_11825 [Anaerolineae bacterium]|nr:hypothetical protein [Anaerolineae bacterium]
MAIIKVADQRFSSGITSFETVIEAKSAKDGRRKPLIGAGNGEPRDQTMAYGPALDGEEVEGNGGQRSS